MPSQLLGNWYLPPGAVEEAAALRAQQPNPPNCFFQLTLAATTYQQFYVATSSNKTAPGQGDVVVNNDEIDFFNGVLCGLKAAKRHWTLHVEGHSRGPLLHADFFTDFRTHAAAKASISIGLDHTP